MTGVSKNWLTYFHEQALGLLRGGVDLLLIETSQDILEVKAVIDGIQRSFAEIGHRVPIQAQITLDTSGRMLFGTDIYGALTTLAALPVDLIGLNCSTGPEHMREPIRFLLEQSPYPISVMPNAGLPLNVGGEAVYPMQPAPFAQHVSAFAHQGVQVIGGCCGTTPDHIAEMYQRLHGEIVYRFPPEWPFLLQPTTRSDGRSFRLFCDDCFYHPARAKTHLDR